jgi:hypothetical protein
VLLQEGTFTTKIAIHDNTCGILSQVQTDLITDIWQRTPMLCAACLLGGKALGGAAVDCCY